MDTTDAQKSVSLEIMLSLKLLYMHTILYSMPSASSNKSSYAMIPNGSVDMVVLVGRVTRIPKIQSPLMDLFNRKDQSIFIIRYTYYILC